MLVFAGSFQCLSILIFLLSFQSCLMFRELWLTVAAEIPTPFYLILLSSFQSCLMFRKLWLIQGATEIPVPFFIIFLLSFQSWLMFRELWLTVAAEIPTPQVRAYRI